MLTAVAERAFPYPPAYRAETGWKPWLAVVAGALIFAAAAGLGYGALVLSDPSRITDQRELLWVELVVQVAIVALTVLAAGLFGSRRRDMLALKAPPRGWRDIAAGLAAIAAASGFYTLLTTFVFPGEVVRDLKPLWAIMQSPWGWLLALIAIVGAPLSEEFLFRGFLQSALSKSGLGFARAAVLTTAAWTALHASYSFVGLTEVFLVGLVFSWLLWHTGSLWVPILCHGLYNGAVIAFLAAFPVPA